MTRRPIVWVLGSLAALLLVLGLGVGAYLTAVNQVPAYTPAPVQLPVPNAYDVYVAATAGVKEPKDLFPADKSEPTTAVLRQCAADNREVLAQLRRGFRHQYMTPPRYGYSALFPELAKFRSVARVLAAEGKLAEREGRYKDAARSYLDCIRLGSNIPRGGPLIHWLVGVAVQSIGMKPLQGCVEHLDAETARAAARELASIEKDAPTYADAIRWEAEWGQVSLTEMFRTSHSSRELYQMISGSNGSGGGGPGELLLAMQFYVTPKGQVLRDYRTYMDALIKNARQPYYAHPTPPRLPDDPINRMLLPVFDTAQMTGARQQALARIIQVQLAARAYELEHGAPPPSAAALAPQYLPEVPPDPFANAPIRYLLKDGRPLVYSVGPDGADDGGQTIKGNVASGSKGDLRFVAPQK